MGTGTKTGPSPVRGVEHEIIQHQRTACPVLQGIFWVELHPIHLRLEHHCLRGTGPIPRKDAIIPDAFDVSFMMLVKSECFRDPLEERMDLAELSQAHFTPADLRLFQLAYGIAEMLCEQLVAAADAEERDPLFDCIGNRPARDAVAAMPFDLTVFRIADDHPAGV